MYDESGRIIPIGEPKQGKHVYVVWYGRALGIFNNWCVSCILGAHRLTYFLLRGACGAMVNGFPGALYEGFRTLRQAEQAWLNGPSWGFPGGAWTPPALPRTALPTPGYVYAPDSNVRSPPPAPSSAQAQASPTGDTKPLHPPRAADKSVFSCADLYAALPPETKPRRARPAAIVVAQPRETAARGASAAPLGPDVQAPKTSPTARTKRAAKTAPASPSTTVSSIVSTTPSSLASTTMSTVIVPEGRAFVVVRGEHPGVYMDK